MVTHMALGLFDSTSSKIDLVPLHRILQMRPSFAHVDALFQNDDDDDNDDDENNNDEASERAKEAQEEEKKGLKPIVFQKPESERAAMQRKTSYAFKKANEDAEEWIDLKVHGFKSLARKEAMKKAYCPRSARDNHLEFQKGGKTGGSAGYVRSLNYLPSTIIKELEELEHNIMFRH